MEWQKNKMQEQCESEMSSKIIGLQDRGPITMTLLQRGVTLYDTPFAIKLFKNFKEIRNWEL